MKRKRPNDANLRAKKKSKEQDDREHNYTESICERRKLELCLITSERNAMNLPQKRKAINLANAAYEVNSGTSESEDLNEEDKIKFQIFRAKERQKLIENCKIVSRDKAKSALSVLDNSIKHSKEKLTNEAKRFIMLNKHCSKNILHLQPQEEQEHTWDSPMYIMKAIRACILTRNWNNLTCLLLMLLKCKAKYVSYVKQVALLNLMNNLLDYNGEILDELRKLCMASVHK